MREVIDIGVDEVQGQLSQSSAVPDLPNLAMSRLKFVFTLHRYALHAYALYFRRG
jgi:hypothetical protein